MELNDYQERIKQFAVYPEANTGSFGEMNYLVMGLCGEVGEVAGKISKLIRDGGIDEQAFLKEVGDCLWFITMICNCAGTTLRDIAEQNYEKLYQRSLAGTIKGSGDDVRIATPTQGIIVPEHLA